MWSVRTLECQIPNLASSLADVYSIDVVFSFLFRKFPVYILIFTTSLLFFVLELRTQATRFTRRLME